MRTIIVVLAFLMIALNTIAADQIIVTKMTPYPSMGNKANSGPNVVRIISGKEFENIRKDVEAILSLMSESNRWIDYGPDSSYVSIAIMIDTQTYTIDSWYPLNRDKDTVAVVNGSLVYVSNRKEKRLRESQNDHKHTALYTFIDKLFKE